MKAEFRKHRLGIVAAIGSILAIALTTAAISLAQADGNPNPEVLPPDSKAYGKSYSQWTAEWWQWAHSIPASENPLVDETGEFCAEGQSGKVWFLAGTLGEVNVTRECTIPEGKAIFFPIVSADYTPDPPGQGCAAEEDEKDEVECMREALKEYIDAVTVLEVIVDGVPLEDLRSYRAESPVFGITIPEDALFGLEPPGELYPVVSDGYWIMLAPLPKALMRSISGEQYPTLGLRQRSHTI